MKKLVKELPKRTFLESAVCFDTRMQVQFASELISFFTRQSQTRSDEWEFKASMRVVYATRLKGSFF